MSSSSRLGTAASLRLALVVSVIAAAASGCFSPYLKKAPSQPEPNPSSALLAGSVVRFDDSGSDKSLLDAAIDAAQNAELDAFGKKATTLIEQSLALHGYTLTYDGARTRTLDAFQIKSDSTTAALTGQWRHPDASAWTPQTVDSLFVSPKDIVGKVKVDGQKEYFVFASVEIFDSGIFLKEPWVTVRLAAYDADGKKVLDVGGRGSGDSNLFVSNRGAANLEVALVRAFDQLNKLTVESL